MSYTYEPPDEYPYDIDEDTIDMGDFTHAGCSGNCGDC